MSGLPADVLVKVFELLDLKSRLTHRRVCTRWLDESQSFKSLWNDIVIDEDTSPYILGILDRITHSCLKRVFINSVASREGVYTLMGTLERSKETLQILHLDVLGKDVFHRAIISDLSFKLPNLRDFRVRGGKFEWLEVRLNMKDAFEEEKEDQAQAPLKIFWTWGTKHLLENLGMLSNLVSLKVHWPLIEHQGREILEHPSKTLKHLDLEFDYSNYPLADFKRGTRPLTSLEFPRLKVLGLCSCPPCWMLTPSVEVLICLYPPKGFPGALISELWIDGDAWIFSNNYDSNGIGSGFPHLKKLVWKASRSLLEQMVEKHGSDAGKLSFHPLIRQRREKVEAEHEIDGIRMRSLQVLIVSKVFYDFIDEEGRAELNRVPELIVEDETLPSTFDLEI